jgi:epoxyqueuosine reductase
LIFVANLCDLCAFAVKNRVFQVQCPSRNGAAMPEADFSALDAVGLNLHAVFALDQLPDALRDALHNECDPARSYSQLILIGNGGRALWQTIQREGGHSADPIDDFSVREVRRWLAAQASGLNYEIVYPGERLIGLQSIGERAGWHFASPFMVGINECWGTWFAYRVAVLADTDFEPTRRVPGESPCTTCRSRPCVAACPGNAIESDGFNLANCVNHRLRPDSACRTTCLARLACPMRAEHRYDDDQIRHAYAISMRFIEAYQCGKA